MRKVKKTCLSDIYDLYYRMDNLVKLNYQSARNVSFKLKLYTTYYINELNEVDTLI